MGGKYIFNALSGASSPGTFGPPLMFNSPRNIESVTYQLSFTGAPTDFTVIIYATFDGVNFGRCIPADAIPFTASSESGDFGVSNFHLGGSPILGLKLALTRLEGGTAPTVSVLLGVDED